MDLQEQLRQLFPDHEPENVQKHQIPDAGFGMQDDPIICKYEKRKGKGITLLENYNGTSNDFKKLTQILQREFHVGASAKDDIIILQTSERDRVMTFLKSLGFIVKRVGG